MAWQSSDGQVFNSREKAQANQDWVNSGSLTDFSRSVLKEDKPRQLTAAEQAARDRAADAASESATIEIKNKLQSLIPVLINDYNNCNWDAIINVESKLADYFKPIFGLKAIACGKKLDYKKSFRWLSSLEFSIHNKDCDLFSAEQIENAIGNSDKLIALSLKAAKEAVSNFKKCDLTDDEFNQFYLSFCENEIRINVRANRETVYNYWLEKWNKLSKKPMTIEDKKRIAGQSSFLKVHFFGKRNGFLSFLLGLVLGSGTAFSIDWVFVNHIVNLSSPFIILLLFFILFAAHFWRKRYDIGIIVLLVLCIPGWLAIFGVLPSESLNIFTYLSTFKEIFN